MFKTKFKNAKRKCMYECEEIGMYWYISTGKMLNQYSEIIIKFY